MFCFFFIATSVSGLGFFDPNEDREEATVAHEGGQFMIVRDIDRRLSRELKREVVCLLPGLEMRQERTNGFLVADQVVVNEIDMATKTERVQRVEFR